MSRTKTAASITVGLAVAYLATSLYLVSASLTPSRGKCLPSDGPPHDVAAEQVQLTNPDDGTGLAAWHVPASNERAVILVHGIDSDAWRGAQPDKIRAYRDAGFDVLVFDLRAHGQSEGRRISLGRSEPGDVRAAVDLLVDRGIPPGRIGLHGSSYGAAMALLAAAEIPQIGAVIADSAFADSRDLIAAQVKARTGAPEFIAGRFLRPGIELAAKAVYGLDLGAQAPELAVARIPPRPLLLIHGAKDPVVPLDHARRLSQAAGPTAELWILDGAGHTEGIRSGPCNLEPAPGRAAFLDRVVSFLDAGLK